MLFYFEKKTEFVEIGNYRLSRFGRRHALVFSAEFVDLAFLVDDVDLFKVVAFARLKVVEIVGRRDFYGTCSKFDIDQNRVSDYRNLTVGKRKFDLFADEVSITLVFGVDCDRAVAEKRFGTSCCDRQELVASRNRVFDVPEVSFDILVIDFKVGKSCSAVRTPVDDVCVFVDEPFFVKRNEDFSDRF